MVINKLSITKLCSITVGLRGSVLQSQFSITTVNNTIVAKLVLSENPLT